ncbi:mRNA 3'-end-processing protein rna14 [Entophlyctis sp. JEL0112]|nr:mRNA 3'-end-processing protein rna14 [Entophlyctis sp. JEL0112]
MAAPGKKKQHGSAALDALRARATADDGTSDAWAAYLAEAARAVDSSAEARAAFDAAVARFPSAVQQAAHWIAYIEFERKLNAFDRVEELFNKCLRSVISVSLWHEYIKYIRTIHSPDVVAPEKRAESQQIVLKAYDLVLANVGLDKDSGNIWLEYLAYIKSIPSASKYEEQQMMDLQRKVYQKAVSIPLANIETIWKDYDAFENSLNKLTAKKFLSERSATYMTARTAFRELKMIMAPIDAAQPTWLPSPTQWTETDFDLVRCNVELRAWKKLIAWEKSNPLRLDDAPMVASRVMFAYKSSLLMMRYFPELWHDAARYLIDIGKTDEAITVLHQAVEVLPKSLLLSFALAELEESQKKDFAGIAAIFDSLIANLEAWVIQINAKYDKERETLLTLLRGTSEASSAEMADWDGERRELEREKEKERNAEVDMKVEQARKKKLIQAKEAWSLAWIVYMRAGRRAQVRIGLVRPNVILTLTRRMSHMRGNCSNKRVNPTCALIMSTLHQNNSSALMEYHTSKDVGIACKIFELGLKAVSENETADVSEFVTQYLDFLIQMNDDNNARALFERALSILSPEQARGIWSRFFMNEVNNGDLANVLKLEKRMREVYTEDDPGRLVADRWRFLSINFIATEELGMKETVISGSLKSSNPTATTDNILFSRPKNLDPVVAVQHVLPDTSKWAAYKPEARSTPLIQEKTLEPAPTTKAGGPIHSAASQGSLRSNQATGGGAAAAPVAMLVPEPIVQVLNRLPPASSYNGPAMPIDAILDVLMRLPLPNPTPGAKMVPLVLGGGAAQQAPAGSRRGASGNSRSGGRGKTSKATGKRKDGAASSDDDHRHQRKR